MGRKDARVLPEGITLHKRYIVGNVLGIGGFGITYAAYDKKQRERLAIKEYFPAEWAMREQAGIRIVPGGQTKNKVYRHGQEVFINEAKILNRLQNIPSVVNVKDFFAENGTAYMVMEYVDGYTLSGYMRQKNMKYMPYDMAGKIIKNAGIAAQQVHEKMLLHRDMGPDNIMLLKNGEIRLIDFGATRMYAMNSNKSMSVLIKPGFAPIEQYSRTGKQGPWTDVYALAATYYYLVTGTKPPQAPDRIAGTTLVPLHKQTNPHLHIPYRISKAVEHALKEDWKKRTKSMREFLTEMGMLSTPYILMKTGERYMRYPIGPDYTFCIGRAPQTNQIVLSDRQVSAVHCEVQYDVRNNWFYIKDYSSNCTFTSRGTLKKGKGAYFNRGEWFCIRTSKAVYTFYLEVE